MRTRRRLLEQETVRPGLATALEPGTAARTHLHARLWLTRTWLQVISTAAPEARRSAQADGPASSCPRSGYTYRSPSNTERSPDGQG